MYLVRLLRVVAKSILVSLRVGVRNAILYNQITKASIQIGSGNGGGYHSVFAVCRPTAGAGGQQLFRLDSFSTAQYTNPSTLLQQSP